MSFCNDPFIYALPRVNWFLFAKQNQAKPQQNKSKDQEQRMNSFKYTFIIWLFLWAGYVGASTAPEGVSATQWQHIKQQISATRYWPQAVDGGDYAADNQAQGWRLRHASDGMTTLDSGTHRIGLKLQSIGSQRIDSQPVIEVKQQTLYYHHSPTIKEWWVNSAEKTEQWFGIRTRPVTGRRDLRLEIALHTDAMVSQTGDQLIFTNQQGQRINYQELKVWDSRGQVLPSRMQLTAENNSFWLIVDDQQATYPITIDPSFTQDNYVKPAVLEALDRFGWSVDISGNFMIVGTIDEDSAATTVNGDSHDNSASNAGAAYVFNRSGTSWVQEAYLKASNAEAGDLFGRQVAISGLTAVVGVANEDGDASSTAENPNNNATSAGAVYVFARDFNGDWEQQAYLKAHDTGSDEFGGAVDIDGSTIVVGAKWEDGDVNSTFEATNNDASNAGAVYVFERSGSSWSQTAYLKASNAEDGDEFGYGVALDGDTLVVSAKDEDGDANSTLTSPNNAAPDAGAVYVWQKVGGDWEQQAYLKAHNAGPNDLFGEDVAIDDETIVVSAYQEDGDANSTVNQDNNNAIDSGAAYVYVKQGADWQQQAYLKASNAEADDDFGLTVAIAGEKIVVGAPKEDGDVNSTMQAPNNNADAGGAAYVFTRRDDQWQQTHYLKAENLEASDRYGQAVAMSNEHTVVSAYWEDGDVSSTMTNPNNNASSAGAVYVIKSRYFVGGEVAGLPFGESVELLRNGIEVISADHNGNYQFLSELFPNTSYSVSVSAAPPGYTCSVVNASGTIPYDDVIDVDVFCANNSYNVGVNVMGLSGTGLVVRNNGVFDLIINDNGTHVFSTPFADGTPYSIEVVTQPGNGQNCDIATGVGVIDGSHVIVEVVCPGLEYEVGGTVSGLSGSLTLQNNGGDDLDITVNGSFTFPNTVTDGDGYAVTVASQPVGQTCQVIDGSGIVMGNDVTDVSVSCVDDTYLIGGTVSGVMAAGLVLQNNGGDDLVINGNGQFTFTSALTDGSGYEVSVLSQPSGQACSVTDGSGVVAAADVTDVSVTCVDNRYFIGGMVSGLTNPGLVLQNNGSDDLNINGNGGFVFPQPLVDGSSYVVTVVAEPSQQNCAVSNASGTVVGADVIDVGVNCMANSYRVGVSVSGLTGPGLVLQNNGNDELMVSQNGVSAFAMELQDGESYSISVLSQPDDVSNTCELNDLSSGLVTGDDVLVPVLCGNDLIFAAGFD